ncbi:MAG: DNA primase, partial [Patescibacteria group bacterium]
MEHSQNYPQTNTRNQVQEVKDAIDIVQMIGERVHLTKAGKSFKGLCPFHSEKSPSFFVTSDIQRYKCFGCAKSGDIFTFLEEYEGMTFAESLQELAGRAGITLERHVFTKDDVERQRLYEILSLAREYYHYILTEHKSGKPARDYLQSRGVAHETITTFKLGYALDSWDALQRYLINKKKYTRKELLDAGLLVQGNSNRPYDRFRGRVMFPLTDTLGKVVGFSGRVLDPKAKEAKYINSPETQLYHKSELLFGYSILKPIIKKEEEVFVVEGELDALSSYQAGVKNVVAIKGSALSDQQMRLLSRTAKRVVLALDADNAGVEATIRAIEVA